MAVIGLFFASGFILPLVTVVVISITIQASLVIFDGCFITRLQHKLKALPENVEFIPYVVKKVSGFDISEFQHEMISFLIFQFPLIVAVIKSY